MHLNIELVLKELSKLGSFQKELEREIEATLEEAICLKQKLPGVDMVNRVELEQWLEYEQVRTKAVTLNNIYTNYFKTNIKNYDMKPLFFLVKIKYKKQGENENE